VAATRGRSSRGPLGAELKLPDTVTVLEPGDRGDMLLELVAFPLTAERYYGPDDAFRRALATGADTWRPVQREAAGNRPTLRHRGQLLAREFPVQVPVDADSAAQFSIAGGLGVLPLRLTGLKRPDAVELHRLGRSEGGPWAWEDSERVARQADFDAATGRWSVTYTVPTSEGTVIDYEVRPGTATLPGVHSVR